MQGIKANLPMEEIKSEYNKGKSTYEISKSFDVCSKTIFNHLKQSGINFRYRGMKDVNLTPSKELAFFIGFILGDGWVYHNKKTNNYSICMETSNLNQIKEFKKCVKICFPNLSICPKCLRKVKLVKGGN